MERRLALEPGVFLSFLQSRTQQRDVCGLVDDAECAVELAAFGERLQLEEASAALLGEIPRRSISTSPLRRISLFTAACQLFA